MPDVTRILLIDDHSLFREAIARLLGAEPDFQVTGECATVEEGLSHLRTQNADVVLLDINLGLQQGGASPRSIASFCIACTTTRAREST